MNGIEKVGHSAAAIMETIDNADLPDDAEIAEVMVIAAVAWPENAGAGNCTYYRCTSSLPWVQKGLLLQADDAIDASRRPVDE